MAETAIIMGLVGFSFILLLLAYILDHVHVFLKFLLYTFVVHTQLILSYVLLEITEVGGPQDNPQIHATLLNFHWITTRLIWIYWVYVGVFVIYTVLDFFGKIPIQYSMRQSR